MHRTRGSWMKKGGAAAGLAGLLLLAGACAGGRPEGAPLATTEAGDLVWKLWLDPNPPRQEGNTLWVAVEDSVGEPVAGAEVTLEYLMPAMGAMAEMRGRGEVAEVGEGFYRVGLDFPMGGTWGLTLTVAGDGVRAAAEYSLTVGSAGLRELGTRGSGTALAAGEGHVEHAHGGDVAYYTCSMHPSVKSDTQGTCPICSMDLVPVTREELETGVIRVDAQRRQEIGVRTAPVTAREVETTIRAVGTVTYDETKLSAVSLKYEGWIERLYVEETGQPVRRGQPLLALYSPALLAAQEELLTALASQRAARDTEVPDRADYLVAASRRRLALWDLSARQIDELAETGKPLEAVPVFSPVSGFVVEKNVVEGQAVKPGETLYRIAGLDTVWIDAEVYESELPLVAVGQRAEVSFPYLPGRSFDGRVGYIYPYLEGGTRTGRVRVELPNPGLELKAEMYANVLLTSQHGARVMVPEEAVIYAGPRRLVFVDLGEGRLQPREIEVGMKAGDAYEVLSGLLEGEVVVISGNFLIAAESRIKSATEKW